MPVIAIANFRGAQWTKLVINMLNAVPAIVGRSVQDVVDDRRLRRVVAASMREAALQVKSTVRAPRRRAWRRAACTYLVTPLAAMPTTVSRRPISTRRQAATAC